jgi:hypothetical protein
VKPRIKPSSHRTFQQMLLEEWEAIHSRYCQHAVQLQLDAFLDHVIPSTLDKDQLLRLTEQVDITKLKVDVAAERERNQGSHETELFQHISTTIFNRIVEAGKKLGYANENFARMKDTPETAPISLRARSSSTRPDSNILLKETSSARSNPNDETYFCDVFVTCEYKREEAYEVDRQDVSGCIASEWLHGGNKFACAGRFIER